MNKERPSGAANPDDFDRIVELVGPDEVAKTIADFGVPLPGSPEEAAYMARFKEEDSLEARATAPDAPAPVVMPGMEAAATRNITNITTEKDDAVDTVDLRDGFDVQRTEGLVENDPITEATIAASNGDMSLLEALPPEDRTVADMLMTTAADTGERPADIAADLANPLDDGQLPPANLNQPNPEA